MAIIKRKNRNKEMEEMIILDDVCFKYQSTHVLEEVFLQVHRGEFVGIVGRNGSGKSTLMKLLMKILKPDHGKIVFQNNLKTSYVEQLTLHSDISFPTNVFETVMLGLYQNIGAFKFPNKQHKEAVMQALDMVGLSGYERKQISNLSGGEQQRVMIAKALVSSPDLLILDEPTAGIDADAEQNFLRLLVKLNQEMGKTIIMVTHDKMALSGCNRVYEISDKTLKEVKHVIS